MPRQLQRRSFLMKCSQASLGFLLLPHVTQAQESNEAIQTNENPNWDALILDLEKQIPILLEEAKVPGLSIAIIKDAELFWRKGFGVKDNATKEPVDHDTIFEACSMSKPVFAYAVMKLCEKEILNLDTPLTKYTSERFLEGDTRLDLITARHVLSHTSGFQNWRTDDDPLKIQFTPGEKYSYSGEGYHYLQSVVTHLTGQQIEPFMNENVFVPMGLSSCGYIWNGRIEQHAARPHDREGKPLDYRKRTAEDAARYAAAGDLFITPTDYAKFMIEVIAQKESDLFRLNQSSIQEMLRLQVKGNDEFSWALGWQVLHYEKGDVISHGGENPGFQCINMISPEKRSGYVMMTNSDNGFAVLKKLVYGEILNRVLFD